MPAETLTERARNRRRAALDHLANVKLRANHRASRRASIEALVHGTDYVTGRNVVNIFV